MNIEKLNIENLIYEIRGVQVMLDSDLANLYGCKNGTKTINLAVKRNIERFPKDFYFQLTEDEIKIFWFQIETKKGKVETRGGKFNKPYVFTEQGVAMLSSVLRTENASIVSVSIMRAFVNMRHFIKNNYYILENVYHELDNHQKILNNHEEQIEKLFSKFKIDEYKELVYFEGQIYDAYSKILDIMNLAKKELVIIDGYADKVVLDIIRNIKVSVTLIIKEKSKLSLLDIEKYNKEYDNLKIIKDNSYHDRYIIIDNKTIYHCGTSINNAGNKTFGINKLEDNEIIESILSKLKSYN